MYHLPVYILSSLMFLAKTDLVEYVLEKRGNGSYFLMFDIDDVNIRMISQLVTIHEEIPFYLLGENRTATKIRRRRKSNDCVDIEIISVFFDGTLGSLTKCSNNLTGIIFTKLYYINVHRVIYHQLDVHKNPLPSFERRSQMRAIFPDHIKLKRDATVYQFDPTGVNLNGFIELVVFTENFLYKEYCDKYATCEEGVEELNDYLKTTVKGADLFYRRIQNPHLKLAIRLKGVYHNTNESLFSDIEVTTVGSNEKGVEISAALSKFGVYQSEVDYGLNLYPDHATLFVKHQLLDSEQLEDAAGNRGTIGISYVGRFCYKHHRVSIVQMQPAFETVFILAHELGHNLGAHHDGYYKVCDVRNNYIMSPFNQEDNMRNILYFSCCSQIQVMRQLYFEGWCLPPTDGVNFSVAGSAPIPGEVLDRSAQCKLLFGEQYVPCNWKSSLTAFTLKVLGENECTIHLCEETNGIRCHTSREYIPLPGTACSDEDWCNQGECRSKDIPLGAAIPENQPICDYQLLARFFNDPEGRDPSADLQGMSSSLDMIDTVKLFAIFVCLLVLLTALLVLVCLCRHKIIGKRRLSENEVPNAFARNSSNEVVYFKANRLLQQLYTITEPERNKFAVDDDIDEDEIYKILNREERSNTFANAFRLHKTHHRSTSPSTNSPMALSRLNVGPDANRIAASEIITDTTLNKSRSRSSVSSLGKRDRTSRSRSSVSVRNDSQENPQQMSVIGSLPFGSLKPGEGTKSVLIKVPTKSSGIKPITKANVPTRRLASLKN